MAQILTKKQNDKTWDFQVYLRSTWDDHLKALESSVYESSIMHGFGCHCCTRCFMMEERKKK